ncbi:putative endonuclease [Marinicella litoralis]|uniref:Putative endonuclease n=2 Tax=Marinicella litoralis TaxID=644220 RepID=A0A4R6XVH0_9GAMM|nr:putative endonuclease [Marinicella litoralis]
MEMKNPAVYVLTNQRNGTLYIGVTSDLIQRIYQHKSNAVEGFSKKYQTHMLVYFEQHLTMESALLREKQMKEWKRAWKINLIEKLNPFWKDLYQDII